ADARPPRGGAAPRAGPRQRGGARPRAAGLLRVAGAGARDGRAPRGPAAVVGHAPRRHGARGRVVEDRPRRAAALPRRGGQLARWLVPQAVVHANGPPAAVVARLPGAAVLP